MPEQGQDDGLGGQPPAGDSYSCYDDWNLITRTIMPTKKDPGIYLSEPWGRLRLGASHSFSDSLIRN